MISVIIATYNGECYIEKQLESIRLQTQKVDEVIISDDCSSDNTVNIVASYIAKYRLSGWRIIKNKKNIGYFDNFIKLLKEATGEFIFLSDQDDVWNLKKVEIAVKQFKKDSSIMMVQNNFEYIDNNDNSINIENNYHRVGISKNPVELNIIDMCKFAGSGFTMAISKQIVDFIITNELYSYKKIFEFHDILLGLVSAMLGRIIYISDIADKHRLHDKNVTEKRNVRYKINRSKEEHLLILENKLKRLEILLEFATENILKQNMDRYHKFLELRISLVQGNIRAGFKLLKQVFLYYDKKAIVADFLYGMGLEDIVNKAVGH